MDQAVYVDGVRRQCGDLSDELEVLRANPAQPSFLWIGLKNPTQAEFDVVKDELGLHPLAIEDTLKGNQRAKIERYGSILFVVMKPLHYIDATSDIETGEIMLFVGDRFVLTVRRGEVIPLRGVRDALEARPDILRLGPVSILHAIGDVVVDGYGQIDTEIERDLDAIEEIVFADGSPIDSAVIYRLKREVLEFKRATAPLSRAWAMLHGPASPFPEGEARHLLRDVGDHLLRVLDHAESYDRLLTDVLHAHLAQVGVRQNADMRKISSWVAMAAVPTMVAGIYGMNFDHMPELRWEYGYFVVLALMFSVCLGLYTAFKRSDWL